MSQRTERVDELLRQEIGAHPGKDVQDPHIGFATVTAVETTPDLRHARVRVSVIGGSAERAETVAALERARATSAMSSAAVCASVGSRPSTCRSTSRPSGGRA